eukprot:scaffold3267_cov142-Amphora_coffeaeformis.AAC.8
MATFRPSARNMAVDTKYGEEGEAPGCSVLEKTNEKNDAHVLQCETQKTDIASRQNWRHCDVSLGRRGRGLEFRHHAVYRFHRRTFALDGQQ